MTLIVPCMMLSMVSTGCANESPTEDWAARLKM